MEIVWILKKHESTFNVGEPFETLDDAVEYLYETKSGPGVNVKVEQYYDCGNEGAIIRRGASEEWIAKPKKVKTVRKVDE